MMKMQHVSLVQTFDVPVNVLFAHFCKHENVGKLFAAKFIHAKDGHETKYGVGSVRDITNPLLPTFQETVVIYQENALIEYKITSGFAPIKEHYGRMRFVAIDNYHSRLDYDIQFKGKVPCIGEMTRWVMQTSGERYLKKLRI